MTDLFVTIASFATPAWVQARFEAQARLGNGLVSYRYVWSGKHL